MSGLMEQRFVESVVFLLLIIAISCRPTVGPFAPDYYYVSTISGLSVRDNASLAGKMIDLLALNEPVQIVERELKPSKVSNRVGYWVKIKYSQNQKDQSMQKEGWVFDVYLNHQPVERFFIVKPLAGVEMRELPDLRAKVLVQVPYATVGLIETASRRIDTIRGRRGYWFRTTYQDQVGWIFSGLVTTSLHRYVLERESNLDLREVDLEATNRSLDDLLANVKSIQVIDGPDYRVHVLSYFLRDHELCDGPESRLIFERHRDGELFITNTFSAQLIKANSPLQDTFLVKTNECGCCISKPESNAIFADRAGPVSIAFYTENLEAGCIQNQLEQYAVLRSENRIDPESGDLFFFWQEPKCDFQESGAVGRRFWVEAEYQHDIFGRIHFVDGRLRINQYQDRRIPRSLQDAWSRSMAIIN